MKVMFLEGVAISQVFSSSHMDGVGWWGENTEGIG